MRDMGESGPLNSAAAREVTISLVTINPRCQPAVMRCELYMYLMRLYMMACGPSLSFLGK